MMYEAVQKFSAYDIGCLVTTNDEGRLPFLSIIYVFYVFHVSEIGNLQILQNNFTGSITGVVSERDYINKIALLGRSSKGTPIREVSTKVGKLETATLEDSVDKVCLKFY